MLLFKFYNEELKLENSNKNDLNALDRYILNQKKYINSFTKNLKIRLYLEFTNKFQ